MGIHLGRQRVINITCQDSLEYIKSLDDYSVDLVFTDPPYGLGSEIIIRPDGKPDYKKAGDFMSKWDMPTGEYWEQWFKEAFRVLKFSGHLLMFGIGCGGNGIYSKSGLFREFKAYPAAGISKILHKCAYEDGEHDLYMYQPKVSAGERSCQGTVDCGHPTLKPIALNNKILSLFKTPNPQTILLPFAGAYSGVIAAYQVGFDTIIGCELSEEYKAIGETRLAYHRLKLKDERLF